MKVTDKIEITNEDNMLLMARYPDNYFDLAIVDPPYGIGESSKNRNGITKLKDKRNGRISYVKTDNEIKDWDKNPPPVEYFIELQRISKNQIIFGANHFIELIPNANSSSWFVWDKCNGTSDFADCELAWTSFNSAVRQFRFMWSGMFQGKQSFTNGHIFEGNLSLHEKRIHKTHKPVIIYKWLLDKYAKPNDKILDTHLGSGSIAIACHDYGFELTACELDLEYYEKAVERINNHVAQLKLF
jgi:site-specific DNA-methyltransferase (adenine-specific)